MKNLLYAAVIAFTVTTANADLDEPLPFQLLPSNADYNRARESVGDATMFDVALGERLLAA